MDPLSITASIIAVVQLSNSVLTYCYRFHMQVKDANSDILQVISELEDLRAILSEILELVPKEKRQNEGNEYSGLQLSLSATETVIADISGRLEPLLKKGLLNKLKWPFESKAIQEKVENLQRQKTTFQLFLSIRQTKLLKKGQDQKQRAAILNWFKTSDPEQNHRVSRSHHEPGTCSWIFENDSFQSWSDIAGKYLWVHGIPGAGKTIICSTIIDYVKTLCAENSSYQVAYYYFDFSDRKKQNLVGFLQSIIYQLLTDCPQGFPEAIETLCDKNMGLQEPSAEELFEALAIMCSDHKVFIIVDALDECPRDERQRFYRIFLEKLDCRANILITSRRESDIEKAFQGLAHDIISIQDSKVDSDVSLHVTKVMAEDLAFQNWTSAAIKKEVLDAITQGAHGMFRWAVCQLDTMKQCFTLKMVRTELGRMPMTLDQTYDRILQGIPEIHHTFVQSALLWLAFSNRPLLLSELGEAAVIDPADDIFDPEESRFLDPEKILELCGPLIVKGQKQIGFPRCDDIGWLDRKLINEGNDLWWSVGTDYITVALSHYSVKEYLTSTRLQQSSLSRYSTSERMAHSFIAQCCLLYILDIGKGDVLTERKFSEYPLLEYCAVNWMEHFKMADHQEGNPIIGRALRLLDEVDPSAYINWLNAHNPDDWVLWRKETDSGFLFRPDFKRVKEAFVSPLYFAAQLGQKDLLKAMIDNGSDVNGSEKGSFGSPLAVAAFHKYESLVVLLLENGADPNGRGGDFGNVLQAAAAGGSLEIVELLVDAGADTVKVGGTWNTPLIAAVTFKNEDVVSFLLKTQADLNVSSMSHGSALCQAARSGDNKTVTRLLAAGANVNDVGPDGTALYAAATSGSLQCIQTLLNRGADVNKGGSGAWVYPLAAAAHHGHSKAVKTLLRAGANVNPQRERLGERRANALEAAIISRDMPTFQVLLDAGCDLDAEGDTYPNSLYAALWTDEMEMAKILLGRNAHITDSTFLEAIRRWKQSPWFLDTILDRSLNIDAHSGSEGSALHLAIKHTCEEVVRILLDKNAYIDAVSDDGTVLTCAISKGMIGIAKNLIQRGADVHREIPSGKSTLLASIFYDCKSSNPDFSLAEMLLSLGVDIKSIRKTGISTAIDFESPQAIRYLAQKGIDFKSISKIGEYDVPLEHAAKIGNLEVMDSLLELGADLNSSPEIFAKVLHYGFISGDQNVVYYLLEKGTLVDDTADTFSLLCDALEVHPYPSVVPILIERGADINKLCYDGCTPLARAVNMGHEDLEHHLRSLGARAAGSKMEALIPAISSRNIQGLRKLLEDDVDPNQAYHRVNGNALVSAVRSGSKEMVELLFENGASLNSVPDTWWSPLGKAAEASDIRMVEYLIQLGADPNDNNSGRCWALLQAVLNEHIEMVDLLLENGADIARSDDSLFRVTPWLREEMTLHLLQKVQASDRELVQNCALQYAANRAKRDLCILLITMGAEVNHTGSPFGSPLHAVVSGDNIYDANFANEQKAIFDLLLERGAHPIEVENFPSVLFSAVKFGPASYCTALLKAGADPNGRGDEEYYTPLQAAVQYAPTLIEPLIEAGANVNTIGGKFGTALHVAAYTHDCLRIAILLKNGARLDPESPKYGSVIQAASKKDTITEGSQLSENESVRAMQLLHSRGASVNTTGGRYGNALQLAAKCDNLAGVKWLIEHGADPHAKGRWGTAAEAAIFKNKWRNCFVFRTALW